MNTKQKLKIEMILNLKDNLGSLSDCYKFCISDYFIVFIYVQIIFTLLVCSYCKSNICCFFYYDSRMIHGPGLLTGVSHLFLFFENQLFDFMIFRVRLGVAERRFRADRPMPRLRVATP